MLQLEFMHAQGQCNRHCSRFCVPRFSLFNPHRQRLQVNTGVPLYCFLHLWKQTHHLYLFQLVTDEMT